MELSVYFSSETFVLKTQQQIARDFARHGFDFEEDFMKFAYDIGRLRLRLCEMLSMIIEKHSGKWMALIYTLDIPEKQYNIFFSTIGKNWIPDFAEIVLKREAQKVFFREKLR